VLVWRTSMLAGVVATICWLDKITVWEESVIIGIDPGLTGAVSFLRDISFTIYNIYDMPVMAGSGKRQQVNAAELTKIFQEAHREYATVKKAENIIVYLERVSAMPGQGVSGMFSFGCSYGIVLGVTAALGYSVHLVTPQSWKKRAGLIGKEKDSARAMAQLLYPGADLARKKDIGRADAILIARFGSG